MPKARCVFGNMSTAAVIIAESVRLTRSGAFEKMSDKLMKGTMLAQSLHEMQNLVRSRSTRVVVMRNLQNQASSAWRHHPVRCSYLFIHKDFEFH